MSGDSVFVYVDTDGNPATGSPTFDGADRAIGTLGNTYGAPSAPLMGTWDPGTGSMSFANAPTLAASSLGGFSASLDTLGVTIPTTTSIRVASMYQGVYDNYFDWAPEALVAPFGFPVAFSTQAPIPTPAPVVTPAPTTTSAPSTSACRVPKVKGLQISSAKRRLAAAGCSFGILHRRYSPSVRRGRIISSSPAPGHRTEDFVDLTVSLGRRHGLARAASLASARTQLAAAEAALERRGVPRRVRVPGSPHARAACTRARIGGQSKCIARGQFCAHRYQRDYRRYGLSCTKIDVNGRYHLQ